MYQLYVLKDIARMSGLSIYTVKFYLKLGLIREVGRSPETRIRYFDDSTVGRLGKIREWRKTGKALADIHQLLAQPNGNSATNAETQQRTNAKT